MEEVRVHQPAVPNGHRRATARTMRTGCLASHGRRATLRVGPARCRRVRPSAARGGRHTRPGGKRGATGTVEDAEENRAQSSRRAGCFTVSQMAVVGVELCGDNRCCFV